MSFGKMMTPINIIEPRKIKDESGFIIIQDVVLARIRAYKEMRHGNLAWVNRSAFSKATALFRFRRIPNLVINESHIVLCDTGRYRILSVEDVKSRKMYTELLCDEVDKTGTI